REEVGRRGQRRRGERPRAPEPLVEVVGAELLVVAKRLLAEADVERDDPPVGEPLRTVGEVGRRVEDDRGVGRGELHQPAASRRAADRTAPPIVSSGWSLPMQAVAPASTNASISRSPAAAVSATTAISGW